MKEFFRQRFQQPNLSFNMASTSGIAVGLVELHFNNPYIASVLPGATLIIIGCMVLTGKYVEQLSRLAEGRERTRVTVAPRKESL